MNTRSNLLYARELARAAGGALLFAFPLMMTMEMWWLGFYVEDTRLLAFIAVSLALLVGLSYFGGFEPEQPWGDVLMDALSAYAVAVLVTIILLSVFGVLQPGMAPREIVGKIGLVAIPAAIGALVARKQFQSDAGEDDNPARATYGGELFLMFAGAVFIAFNVAPTDEVELISHLMTPWHALALAALSIAVQHALVYTIEFPGQQAWPENRKFLSVFATYTVAGYAIALAVSFLILWTFGRLDGADLYGVAKMMIVLGFPAALGAATARLVI